MTAEDWLSVVNRALDGGAFGEFRDVYIKKISKSGWTLRSKEVRRFYPSFEGDFAEAFEAIAGPLPERAVYVEGWARARDVGRIVGAVYELTYVVELPGARP